MPATGSTTNDAALMTELCHLSPITSGRSSRAARRLRSHALYNSLHAMENTIVLFKYVFALSTPKVALSLNVVFNSGES